MIQCHGSFATASCITCGYKVDGEIIFPEIKNKEIPYCPKCNEVKQSILKRKNTKSKSKKKKKKKKKTNPMMTMTRKRKKEKLIFMKVLES